MLPQLNPGIFSWTVGARPKWEVAAAFSACPSPDGAQHKRQSCHSSDALQSEIES
uniref:Uncharacterized protein n=1 Tax=Aegilops tauschii subsp. strangulata TaxID=200361 RepID=A0A453GKD8_AEGTS